MRVSGFKRAVVMLSFLALTVTTVGCTEKVSELWEKVMGMVNKEAEQKVSLTGGNEGEEGTVPEGLEFVSEEFTGMDLDIKADVVTVEGSSMDYDRTVELTNPEIFALVEKDGKKKKFTKISSNTATVYPADKLMDFSGDVVVEGPAGEMIISDSLSWNYSQDIITIDDSYRMKDGGGFIEAEYLRTDIGFKYMDVE